MRRLPLQRFLFTPLPAGVICVAALLSPFAEAKEKAPLTGFVDFHTHPMSHLGFGAKAVHGAPDVGIILPAGTRDCNPGDVRAKSMADALGHCKSTHGGWGLHDNGCGDHIRAAVINFGVDSGFKFMTENVHGDHQQAGYPKFAFWPHHSSKLHQQMWWEWIRRAHAGGLRVMVALTVSSETLAMLLNGNTPYDDKTVADRQIEETKRMVNQHNDFMEIALNSAEAERIIRAGKLAVILGMEVDKIGNFGKPGVRTNEAEVVAEIRRLDRLGVRYAFPIHLIDNAFGGTAVYEILMNFANQYSNGYLFKVKTSPDKAVKYNAEPEPGGPFGWQNLLITTIGGLLRGLGELPFPCGFPLHCPIPPGQLKCCGNYDQVAKFFKPDPAFDMYKVIPRGHVNSLGMTKLGEVAIREMMRKGWLVDIDHMSDLSQDRTVELAEKNGKYPLIMGHNGVRLTEDPKATERQARPAVLTKVAQLGGMLGVGTAGTTPGAFAVNYADVFKVFAAALPDKEDAKNAVGIGTDANGFEPLPHHERTDTKKNPLSSQSRDFYADFFNRSGIKSKQAKPAGAGSWDYITEGGVSHYGLMPEFLHDVRKQDKGRYAYDNLMRSADYFVRMWAKAERAGIGVVGTKLDRFRNLVAIVTTTSDDIRGGSRAWVRVKLRGRTLPEIEVTSIPKGANVTVDFKIPVGVVIGPADIVSVSVRHFSGDCFACARDYWNAKVELVGEGGYPILQTGEFRIGHETKTFTRR